MLDLRRCHWIAGWIEICLMFVCVCSIHSFLWEQFYKNKSFDFGKKIKNKAVPKNITTKWFSPLNYNGFTVCYTVSLPFSQSHDSFYISYGFANFEWIFSHTHNFLRKQRQAAHSVLLKNVFLIWLTKTNQAVAVMYVWVDQYCSLR